jgi:DNA-binding response OmpR family regulator
MEWSARTRRQEDRFPLRGAACVVEPDDELREHMAETLRRMGYTTHETSSGAVGDFIADQIHVQLALINVQLPDVQGLKLVRHFRTTSPHAAIIALTPESHKLLGVVLARIAGADCVLAAPPSDETLGNAIFAACGAEHPEPATANA